MGEIRFDDRVVAKLRDKHGLSPEQVREAVSCGAHDSARWHEHPEYGKRLILLGRDADGSMIVFLRPIDRADGLWQCLTAWRD